MAFRAGQAALGKTNATKNIPAASPAQEAQTCNSVITSNEHIDVTILRRPVMNSSAQQATTTRKPHPPQFRVERNGNETNGHDEAMHAASRAAMAQTQAR